MSDMPACDAEGKPSADAKLAARRAAIELEMEVAPYHRVGTSWWDARIEEMRLINRRLRK
jgi:hypothetical protein